MSTLEQKISEIESKYSIVKVGNSHKVTNHSDASDGWEVWSQGFYQTFGDGERLRINVVFYVSEKGTEREEAHPVKGSLGNLFGNKALSGIEIYCYGKIQAGEIRTFNISYTKQNENIQCGEVQVVKADGSKESWAMTKVGPSWSKTVIL